MIQPPLFAAARRLCLTAALSLGAAAALGAFPDKAITVVSAYPAGGGSDAIARLIAPALGKRLGQTVVVDNKPGASGNIATDYVARAKGDGYTLLFNNSTLTINTALGMRQSFNLQKDLKPLVALASTPIVIAVHPSLPVKTVDELASYARQQGDKLSYSSCGNGSPQHFAGARFAQIAQSQMVHVAYKGCAPAIIDGVSGTVPVLFNTVPNLDALVQAGKLRYIGIAAEKRLAFRPELPTVAEAKGFAGFEAEVWFGLIGPAGLPADVAQRIERETLAVMADKDMQKEFADRLISVRVLNTAGFEKQVAADLTQWKALADELKVKLD